MDSITIQYLIAILGTTLGLCGLLLPENRNPIKVRGQYAKHLSSADNTRISRMISAGLLALGVFVGLGTMAFGDLELFGANFSALSAPPVALVLSKPEPLL